MKEDTPLVAIIGAGPGGTTCAAMLNKLGIKSFIIERTTFPRFAVGESLLPVSLDHFKEAGLLGAVEKMHFIKKPGGVFHNGLKKTRIHFSDTMNLDFDHAFSMPRSAFDFALSEEVEAQGIEILWNTCLEKGHLQGGMWTLDLVEGDTKRSVKVDWVVDASGKALLVDAKEKAQQKVQAEDPRGAIFAHLKDARRPDGFDGLATWVLTNESQTWGWIIPITNELASVGFIDLKSNIHEEGENDEAAYRRLLALFSPTRERFSDVEFARPPKSAFGFKKAIIKPSGEGYCLVGNSLGFLDPVLSSGIALATESAIRSAKGIQAMFSSTGFDWEKEYDAPLLEGINVFSGCVETWYDGTLGSLLHSDAQKPASIVTRMTSILAGGAWDSENFLTRDSAEKFRFLNRSA